MPNIEPPTAQRAATAADPITLRPQGLADRLGVSRRHIYDLIDHPDPARRLPAPFKMGRATFWKCRTFPLGSNANPRALLPEIKP